MSKNKFIIDKYDNLRVDIKMYMSGPTIGDCIYDSMTITTPGILYTSNENKNM